MTSNILRKIKAHRTEDIIDTAITLNAPTLLGQIKLIMLKIIYRNKNRIVIWHMKKQVKRGYIKGYHDKVFPGDNVLIMSVQGNVKKGKLMSINLVKELLPDINIIEYELNDKKSNSYINILESDLCCILKNRD